MARLKGSVKTTNNIEVKALLKEFNNVYDYNSYATFLPSWIDDCCQGAGGQVSTGTQRVSPYKIFSLLRCLDEISTITVAETMNRKRMAITGKAYSKSMIEYWTKALRCASQAISHHKERYHTPDVHTVDTTEQVIYTQEQKDQIREFALAGKLDELSEYVKSL